MSLDICFRKRKLDQVQQLETQLKIQKQNGERLLNEKKVKQVLYCTVLYCRTVHIDSMPFPNPH